MSRVESVIQALKASLVGSIPGLTVYAYVPEDVGALPAVIIYAISGRTDWAGQGVVDDLVTIRLDLMVSRGLTSTAFSDLYTLREAVLSTILADPTLGGSVDTVNGIVYQLANIVYGQTVLLAYQFDIEVKVML